MWLLSCGIPGRNVPIAYAFNIEMKSKIATYKKQSAMDGPAFLHCFSYYTSILLKKYYILLKYRQISAWLCSVTPHRIADDAYV
jgi:hypothetical protein